MKQNKREKKTWYVFCEGGFEELYLKRIQQLINKPDNEKCHVDVNFDFSKNRKPGGKPVNVLAQRASTIAKNPMGGSFLPVVVADVDFRPERLRQAFEKHGKNVTIAYTNVCFELWILLHKQGVQIPHNITKTSGYDQRMSASFLGGTPYDKSETQYQNLLNNIKLSDVINAIQEADKIVTQNTANQKTVLYIYANGTKVYNSNPDLTIHNFVRDVLTQAGLYQP